MDEFKVYKLRKRKEGTIFIALISLINRKQFSESKYQKDISKIFKSNSQSKG